MSDEFLIALLAAALAVDEEETAARTRPAAGGASMAQAPEPEPPAGPTLPEVVSATLLLDLQADTLVLSDNDPVSTWADQSGNGHDFTQAGDARPTKQTVDGYPAVVFDGVDDTMDGGDFADNLDTFAVFYAANLDTASGMVASKYIEDNTEVIYRGWFVLTNNPGLEIDDYDNDNDAFRGVTKPAGAGRYVVSVERLGGNTIHAYINGSSTGENLSGSGNVLNISNSEIVRLGVVGGADGPADYGYLSLPLNALLIYQITDVDNWAADRAAIEAWLADRWGITL